MMSKANPAGARSGSGSSFIELIILLLPLSYS
jgi:hypothetical protein